MKVTFRINLDDTKYKDVIDALMSCPKPYRTEYIAEAIRYTRRNFIPNQQESEDNKKNKNIDFNKIW